MSGAPAKEVCVCLLRTDWSMFFLIDWLYRAWSSLTSTVSSVATHWRISMQREGCDSWFLAQASPLQKDLATTQLVLNPNLKAVDWTLIPCTAYLHLAGAGGQVQRRQACSRQLCLEYGTVLSPNLRIITIICISFS